MYLNLKLWEHNLINMNGKNIMKIISDLLHYVQIVRLDIEVRSNRNKISKITTRLRIEKLKRI